MIHEKYIIFDHCYENIYINFNYGTVFRKKSNDEWEEVVGSNDKNGYLLIKYKGKTIRKHNFIYEQYYGTKIPDDKTVDHISRDKTDNRIINLRLASSSLQSQNRDTSNYSSIYPFVYWHKRDKKWNSYIKLNGKQKHLGYFKDEYSAYLFARNISKTLNLYGANINIPIDQDDIDDFINLLFQ